MAYSLLVDACIAYPVASRIKVTSISKLRFKVSTQPEFESDSLWLTGV